MIFSKDNVSVFFRYTVIVLTISAVCLFGLGFLIFLIPQIVFKIIGILIMACGVFLFLGMLVALFGWIYYNMRRFSDKSYAETKQDK